jgi:hypothetical protein
MNNEVAKTIASQIGNRAFMMIGAKNLVGGDNYLRFRIGRNAKSVNIVTVTLTPADTYDVEYGSLRGTSYKVKASEAGIYADMLHASIERNTGMYTSL